MTTPAVGGGLRPFLRACTKSRRSPANSAVGLRYKELSAIEWKPHFLDEGMNRSRWELRLRLRRAACGSAGTFRRQQIREHPCVRTRRKHGDARSAGENSLGRKDIEQRLGYRGFAGNLLKSLAQSGWANGGGFCELNRGLAFRGAGDHTHLVGSGLADGGGHLAQGVHYLLFNLVDHAGVAEVDLADVNGAELIAPRLRLVRNLGAHGLAHVVARLEHFRQRHV